MILRDPKLINIKLGSKGYGLWCKVCKLQVWQVGERNWAVKDRRHFTSEEHRQAVALWKLAE